MPGHKLGAGIPREFVGELEKLDLTEIPGTDNLHAPTGAIKEAQELAAGAFGAWKSFFLVNGSTVGLHAAIAAMCRPGQRLIVGRDCHRAVIHGMLIAGAEPVYMLPEYSVEFGIHTGITVQTVEKTLREAPDAAGVLITRPNYYGVCSDVRAIAEVVHAHDKLLAVDEAHGSHLVFSPRLPVSALQAGADICIQSAHKTLPALTQGAYLHVGSERVDLERLRYFLDIYQTTSPSYILMAYLDIAREIMQKCGESLLHSLLDTIAVCTERLSLTGIKLLSQPELPGFEHDATRLTFRTRELGLSGYDAEKLLREKFGIQVEMSDTDNIVCIGTVADNADRIERLFSALLDMSRTVIPKKAVNIPVFTGLKLPERTMEPAGILNAAPRRIPLEEAAGKISREIISPYPPGIALVCPGEVFTGEMVVFLREILYAGGIIHGIDENGCVVVI